MRWPKDHNWLLDDGTDAHRTIGQGSAKTSMASSCGSAGNWVWRVVAGDGSSGYKD